MDNIKTNLVGEFDIIDQFLYLQVHDTSRTQFGLKSPIIFGKKLFILKMNSDLGDVVVFNSEDGTTTNNILGNAKTLIKCSNGLYTIVENTTNKKFGLIDVDTYAYTEKNVEVYNKRSTVIDSNSVISRENGFYYFIKNTNDFSVNHYDAITDTVTVKYSGALGTTSSLGSLIQTCGNNIIRIYAYTSSFLGTTVDCSLYDETTCTISSLTFDANNGEFGVTGTQGYLKDNYIYVLRTASSVSIFEYTGTGLKFVKTIPFKLFAQVIVSDVSDSITSASCSYLGEYTYCSTAWHNYDFAHMLRIF
jgi:hypothetical protein